MIPTRAGRFAIANHPWDEPFKRLVEKNQGKPDNLLTPRIGDPVVLDDTPSRFSHWGGGGSV